MGGGGSELKLIGERERLFGAHNRFQTSVEVGGAIFFACHQDNA